MTETTMLGATTVPDPLQMVRGQAATASVLALIAAIALIVAAVAAFFVVPSFEYLRTQRTEPSLGAFWIFEVIARQFFLALPLFLFADALGSLRRAFNEYAAGRVFSEKAGAAVSRAGQIALVAMVFKVATSPTIQASIEAAAVTPRFDFQVVDLAIIAFALFVAAVGRVLDAAAAAKTGNDQII
jgi:hypothetical protein